MAKTKEKFKNITIRFRAEDHKAVVKAAKSKGKKPAAYARLAILATVAVVQGE